MELLKERYYFDELADIIKKIVLAYAKAE